MHMTLTVIIAAAFSNQAASVSEGQCIEMRARLDSLDWLRADVQAESALQEALIRDTCKPSEPSSGVRPIETAGVLLGSGGAKASGRVLLHLPAGDAAAVGAAAVVEHYVPAFTAALAGGGRRRRIDLRRTFSVQCYAAGTSFSDESCGCLGKPKPSEFDLRPTIKIVAGSW